MAVVIPEDEKKERLDSMMVECARSLKMHALVFHGSQPDVPNPKRFNRPFSRAHEQFFEAWDDQSVKQLLVIAHRGFGKTSLFNYAVPSQSIVFNKHKFIVPVSATSDLAVMQSENLKNELLGNDSIKDMIGAIKSDTFTKERWVTKSGVMVFPRGAGQQVRGMLHGDERPSLIICDDLENKESVSSPEGRRQMMEYFDGDLCNTVDRGRDDWRIVVVGTILHEDCLLEGLRSDPDWLALDFPLCDDDLRSNWVSFITDEGVEKLYNKHKRRGELDLFEREFRNRPASKEDAVFKQEYFKYWSDMPHAVGPDDQEALHIDLKEHEEDISSFVLLDPAKTKKVHSAYTAVVGVSTIFSEQGNKIILRGIVNERMYPDEIYEETFKMADSISADAIGYEVTSLNEFIIKPIHDFMYKRGKVYPLIELKPRKGEGEFSARGKGKEGRVAALAFYYRMGAVYHMANGSCEVLERQLLAYPYSKFWDVMDDFAYVIPMMNDGERYFQQTLDTQEEEARLMEHEERTLDRRYRQLGADEEEGWSWEREQGMFG